ncbi:MAG: porin [Rhodocyclaceae bacterium]|nr:porin [Rhodocyclaceae bacterium]
MRRWLCGVCLAGLSGLAAADGATIYGLVDIAAAWGSVTGGRFGGLMRDGGLAGNRVGFRGSDVLAEGLELSVVLESGFLPGSGQSHRVGRTFSRQTWLALSGPFGRLSLGYQYSPGFMIPYRYQVVGGSAGFAPRSTLAFAGGYSIVPGSPGRFDNAVAWTSPTWGGVQVLGIYGFQGRQRDDASGSHEGDDRVGLGASFDAGRFSAGLAWHRIGEADSTGAAREGFVGLSFDTGPVKVVATLSRRDAPGAVPGDNRLRSAGVVGKLAGGEGSVGVAWLDPRGGANHARSVTAGYIRPVSRRTRWYVAINRLTYGAATDALARPGAVVTVAAAGHSATSLVSGFSHTF